jgi:alanine dehydrogenase
MLAMVAVRKISKFILWSRTASNAVQLKEKMTGKLPKNVEIAIAASIQAAVTDADIVCTLTGSKDPIVQRDWLKAGVHINAVGAHTPTTRELDSQTMKDAKIYADKRESLLNEAGDFIIPLKEGLFDASHLLHDLAELVTHSAPMGREVDDITVFKSLGLALEDLATAKMIFDRCKSLQLGSWKQMCEPPT